ncbi:DUF1289 domain-containing protein [Malikia granosa]|uniref:DUF1289 domain-containing protein n=1 Tax=Malikia granosa TaxID=263067 RepID=A0A2S9K9C1_9BURK|nr:DUF1289 domain-containing protein [Malikia granosa]PRD66992.1 DUF1289 domain-containing protein [Malikia granosa]
MSQSVIQAESPSPFLALATAAPKPGQTVPSPCVGICRMTEAGDLCRGCWRTRDELRAWKASDDDAKRAVWQLVEQRQRAAGLQAA